MVRSILQYARQLGKYIDREEIEDLTVWTSELKRTKQTAEYIAAPKVHWKALNEINAVSVMCESELSPLDLVMN